MAKKPPRQLDREITEALAKSKRGTKAKAVAGKRVAHAKKKTAASGKAIDKINIDQIGKLFNLPAWDDVDERNQDYYWQAARGAEDEEAAAQEARDELFHKWHGAVTSVAERLLGEHGLEIDPVGKHEYPYAYKIVPYKSWDAAADKIRETINGVGYFHFNDLREFLDSGPYTARQAVLSHLGTIRDYPAVYGGQGSNQLYETAMR